MNHLTQSGVKFALLSAIPSFSFDQVRSQSKGSSKQKRCRRHLDNVIKLVHWLRVYQILASFEQLVAELDANEIRLQS